MRPIEWKDIKHILKCDYCRKQVVIFTPVKIEINIINEARKLDWLVTPDGKVLCEDCVADEFEEQERDGEAEEELRAGLKQEMALNQKGR